MAVAANLNQRADGTERSIPVGGLLQNFPETLYCAACDANRNVVFITDGVESLTGQPAMHFAGQPLASFMNYVHPEDRDAVSGIMDEAVSREEPYQCEYRVLSEDQDIKWVSERGTIFRDADDRRTAYVQGLIVDVTAMMQSHTDDRAYQDLQQRIDALQKEDSLHRVMGSVAHLFNNKLHAALGFLEMAELQQQRLKQYDVIRALKPIQDCLLDAARISSRMLACAGQIQNPQQHVNLSLLCKELHAEFQKTAPAHISFSLKEDISEGIVLGDANGLREIIRALVQNAFESPGAEHVELLLCGKERSNCEKDFICIPEDWEHREKGHLCVAVRDDGAGISPTMMRQVFDPFFSTKFLGRGIGLSIAVEQLRAHGGCMCVSSTEDVETSFSVCFPIAGPACAAEIDSQLGAQQAIEGQSKKHILVVDDEAPLVQMIGLQVRSLGYEPILMTSAKEALRYLAETKESEIAAVLCDVRMPVLSGWDLLFSLRQEYPSIPVIFMSAYEKTADPPSPDYPIPNGFLRKPYLTDELQAVLAEVLPLSRSS